MSIGIVNGGPLRPASHAAGHALGERRPAEVAPATGTQERGPAQASRQAVPAAAPAGTDPELWAVLTAEERAFFSRIQALGPLTYGRGAQAQAAAAEPLPRGGRLDVRV